MTNNMDYRKIRIYRMTHIDNIEHIFKFGITNPASINANLNYANIGNIQIIQTRQKYVLDNNQNLKDYIPFYFKYKMPMLYNIQTGHNTIKIPSEKIIYCITTIGNIIDCNLDFCFTDGQANHHLSNSFDKSIINNILNIIDIKAINNLNFSKEYMQKTNDLDLIRRKHAEFLVKGDIPIKIIEFAVYNDNIKQQLSKYNIDIHTKSHFYFKSL